MKEKINRPTRYGPFDFQYVSEGAGKVFRVDIVETDADQ